MKKLVFLFALLQTFVYGQNTAIETTTVFITVVDNGKTPVPYMDVFFVEKINNKQVQATTNIKGKAEVLLETGKTYTVQFKDVPNHSEILVPRNSTSNLVKTFVYTGSKATASGEPESVIQQHKTAPAATAALAVVKLVLKNNIEQLVKNTDVKLVCKAINRSYETTTNTLGIAYFLVPINNFYSVTVADTKDVDNINIPNRGGLNLNKNVYYEATSMVETSENDTIKQSLNSTSKPTSARALVDILITDLDGKILPNEKIYLDDQNSDAVYTAITDEKGKTYLLVPKATKYELSFQYERNIDVLDYTEHLKAFRKTEIEYTYVGSKKVEEHFAKATRTKEGFVIDFMSIPTHKINTFDTQKIKTTASGFEINFNSDKVNSPAIHNNTMVLSEGFRSKFFYCFNAQTGKFMWGAELAESGATSATIVDDIALINTYSCTLYAFQVSTGKLLWSKWLASSVFSTPTIANGKVYVTYNNSINSDKMVLGAFDLKTGNVLWQNWVDEEALGSAVAANNHVFVTSRKGTLFQFDAGTGKEIAKLGSEIGSAPTIAGNKAFCYKKINDQKSQLVAIDLTTKKEEVFPEIFTDNSYNEFILSDAFFDMNFNHARPVYSNGQLFTNIGSKMLCIDAATKKINFSIPLDNNNNDLMPVFTGKNILLSNTSKIEVYDLTGKLQQSYNHDVHLITEPIVSKGWIYAGNENGKLISINTKNAALTGWEMWSGNPAHNPVFE